MFGFGDKEWDISKSDTHKGIMRELFNGVVEDGDTYKIVFGFYPDVREYDYWLAKKKVTTLRNVIVGYREPEKTMVLVEVTPALDGCWEPMIYTEDKIDKAKGKNGEYEITDSGSKWYDSSGLSLKVKDGFDDDHVAYIYQPDEAKDFETFFMQYIKK